MCIFIMKKHAENLSECLLATQTSSLVKYPFKSLALLPFSVGLGQMKTDRRQAKT